MRAVLFGVAIFRGKQSRKPPPGDTPLFVWWVPHKTWSTPKRLPLFYQCHTRQGACLCCSSTRVWGTASPTATLLGVLLSAIWVRVKIKPTGDRRFPSMFPFARVPFWVPIFDPQPCDGRSAQLAQAATEMGVFLPTPMAALLDLTDRRTGGGLKSAGRGAQAAGSPEFRTFGLQYLSN